jgi:hypothetical protein
MPIRTHVHLALLLAALLASGAHAAPYPTNQCVGAKQRAAATYCKTALAAWTHWEGTQDATARDIRILKAAQKLGVSWNRAEQRSIAQGVDCADTTLSPTGTTTLVDGDVSALVAYVNGGLTLSNRDHVACGRKLIRAAAKECGAYLVSEGAFVANLAADPHAATRDAARAKASAAFGAAFAKATAHTCPTTATQAGLEGHVTGLGSDVVTNTEISPNVDSTQFTTITPSGGIQYQGKTLNPVCMNGSPYSYFVKRGTVNKLLIYYEGGGACWEQLTCSVPVCDTNVNTVANTPGTDNPNTPASGFADISNPANPFRDWNIVFVSYCSCDIHYGDAVQDYGNLNPSAPIHVQHRGFQNSRTVEKWTREHFVNPDRVFVTGSSAGAYGAWFNAPLHERIWPASHFDVLADAGNGVITQDFLDTQFPHWNFAANLPNDIPGLQATLTNGTGIPGYTQVVANTFPDTRWAHFAAAFDGGTGGQTGFYQVMLNPTDISQWLLWWHASCAWNAKMRQQAIDTAAALPSNYRYYIGTGSRHTMWGSNKVYNDTTGGVPLLVDWVNGMLDGSGAWTNVECTNCGLLLPGDTRPNPLQAPFTQVGSDVVVQCSPSGAFVDGATTD